MNTPMFSMRTVFNLMSGTGLCACNNGAHRMHCRGVHTLRNPGHWNNLCNYLKLTKKKVPVVVREFPNREIGMESHITENDMGNLVSIIEIYNNTDLHFAELAYSKYYTASSNTLLMILRHIAKYIQPITKSHWSDAQLTSRGGHTITYASVHFVDDVGYRVSGPKGHTGFPADIWVKVPEEIVSISDNVNAIVRNFTNTGAIGNINISNAYTHNHGHKYGNMDSTGGAYSAHNLSDTHKTLEIAKKLFAYVRENKYTISGVFDIMRSVAYYLNNSDAKKLEHGVMDILNSSTDSIPHAAITSEYVVVQNNRQISFSSSISAPKAILETFHKIKKEKEKEFGNKLTDIQICWAWVMAMQMNGIGDGLAESLIKFGVWEIEDFFDDTLPEKGKVSCMRKGFVWNGIYTRMNQMRPIKNNWNGVIGLSAVLNPRFTARTSEYMYEWKIVLPMALTRL